jgi:hypothetical protein
MVSTEYRFTTIRKTRIFEVQKIKEKEHGDASGQTISLVRGRVGSLTMSGLTTSPALKRSDICIKTNIYTKSTITLSTFASASRCVSRQDYNQLVGICSELSWQLGIEEPCKHKPASKVLGYPRS